ncbi:MAG: hypothetical protein KJS92_04190 [Bacteroidetes bacterium]|nr:hypothetical protein [Bacteroidota bacterium]
MVDIQPLFADAPEFTKPLEGTITDLMSSITSIKWDNLLELNVESKLKNKVETRLKVIRQNEFRAVPADVFAENAVEVLLDTVLRSDKLLRLVNEFQIGSRFGNFSNNQNTRWVIGIQHRIIPGTPFSAHIQFRNMGKAQTEILFKAANPKTIVPGTITLSKVYPVDGDTLPFHYPPVVYKADNLSPNDKVVFSYFSSPLEPIESRKYLKTTTDAVFNTRLNALSMDTTLKDINELLDQAAREQLRGNESDMSTLLRQVSDLFKRNSGRAKVQIQHALNCKNIPLGNAATGKLALLSNVLKFQAATEFTGIEPVLDIPNLSNIIYVLPYRNNIQWLARIGVYNVSDNGGMTLEAFADKFERNSFSANEMSLPMLSRGYVNAKGTFHVGMRTPKILKTEKVTAGKDAQGRNYGEFRLSFLPSEKPSKLLPTPDNNDAWRQFELLSVAQQWNIEVSRDRNFRKLDTLISKRIVKNYDIRNGEAAIINDLYTAVDRVVRVRDSGRYYWRVTWSNVSDLKKMSAAEAAYYRNLFSFIATSELIGNQNIPLDSLFNRNNYKFSRIDSFDYHYEAPKLAVSKPGFELVYPLEGDTIPFYYPPVVVKKSPADTAFKFVLSTFNSTLEPFRNVNYYILDPNHAASRRLRGLSYDTGAAKIRNMFDVLAREQLLGEGSSQGNTDAAVAEFTAQTTKRLHLQFFQAGSSGVLPLGNSARGKLNLVREVMKRQASLQLINGDATEPETPSLEGLVYTKPYKDVYWNARLAYYTPLGTPITTVDSFERMFREKRLSPSSAISPENKAGLAFFEGRFHVGMRRPELIRKFNGGAVSAKTIEITFRPSSLPQRLLPETENNEAWNQWNDLFVAQQWNIEVSAHRNFDTLVLIKARAVVDKYSVPGSTEKLMNDLFNIRRETISLPPNKKYYYRITWSNPTKLDTGNSLHMSYLRYQVSLMADAQRLGAESQGTMEQLSQLLRKANYSFSATDSFYAADSTARKDTAICGLSCRFDMNGVPTAAVSGGVKVNDEISVGLFTMKVSSISENVGAKTYSGKGRISSNLFSSAIAVRFDGIQVNAQKRLISGVVKAEHKKDNFMSRFGDSTNTGFVFFDELKNKYINAVSRYGNEQINKRVADETELKGMYDYLNAPLNLISDAILADELSLPLGLSREVDNFPYTIAITDIQFGPTDATLNAAAILQFNLNEINQYAGFGISGVCITPKGLGDIGSGGALELMGEFKVPMGSMGTFSLIGREPTRQGASGTSGTRLVWDCKGFKQIDIKVGLEMDTSFAVPIYGKRPDFSKRLKATGHMVAGSLNNWLLSMDFDTTYELRMMPGFTLKNRQAALDFSDLANPQLMTFPNGYAGERGNAWKGLYIKEIGVRLPDLFSEKDTINGVGFAAQNIIIDESGFTGTLATNNLVSLNSGTLAGWKYSLDDVHIDITQNALTRAGMSGQIVTPFLTESLAYGITFGFGRSRDSVKLNFSINPTREMTFPAWFARVTLNPGSKIELIGNPLNPKSLRLQTNFNGSISPGADDIAGFKDVRLGTLPFEGLKVRTAFYTLDSFSIKLDKLGGINMNRVIRDNASTLNAPAQIQVSGTQKTGGFPIAITDFGMDQFNGKCLFDLDPRSGVRIGIKFKVSINVAEAGGNGIGGACRVGLYGGIGVSNGKPVFAAKGITVDTIRIDAQLSGVMRVKGGIVFIANHPVFGNGVAGMLQATMPVLELGVTGMFGEVRGLRYWMFGAKASINPGIPIDFSANVIYANSFSGEAWYHMDRTPGTAADQAAGFQIGKSPSGASFTPNSRSMFGFGAALGLTGPPGSPLSGDIGLYAQINNTGGLSRLTMEGNLWMTEKEKMAASVLINGNATIDVDNRKFVGAMSALVNVANGTVRGRRVITLEGRNYYEAGSVQLLINQRSNEWYIKLGDPFQTNGKLGFGFYAGSELLFDAGGYFMMGNKLSRAMPPMSDDLSAKLKQSGINIPTTRPASGSNGFTILAGIDANIPEKKIELGGFYAGIAMQFAADGMLAPAQTGCSGRNGIGGWYITGKAYGVINGALGIHVDLPVFKGDIIAAELNAGMMVDAGLVNPYYFKGQFAANYSVLGGLLEGSKTFDFEMAEDERCKPNLNQKKITSFGAIVADAKPANNTTDVLVGVEPSIALNFPVNTVVKFKTEQMDRNKKVIVEEQMRIRCAYVRLRDETLRYNRKIRLIVSADSLDLRIRPDSFLKDQRTRYTLSANFVGERYNATGKRWEPIKRTSNRNWDTTVIIGFNTEAEASFQADYVSYSTPLAGENCFKTGEHSQGKIVFRQNNIQSTFFTGTLSSYGPLREVQLASGYNRYYGLFSKAGNPGDTAMVALQFGSSSLTFPMPKQLDSMSIYQFRLIKDRVPGYSLNNASINRFNTINGISIRTRSSGESGDRRVIMYSMLFKVSRYKTMEEKIRQLFLQDSTIAFLSDKDMTVSLRTNEAFEEYEIKSFTFPISGGNTTLVTPLIVACSNLAADDQPWIKDFYRPRVFMAGDSIRKRYPSLSGIFLDRTKQQSGVSIIPDDHILKPMPNFSLFLDQYDLRLADNRLRNLNNVSASVAKLREQGISADLAVAVNNTRLSIDPMTGEVGPSGPSLALPPVNTGPPPPPLGSRLNLSYSKYKLIADDFSRLKSMASQISTSGTTWNSLTEKEQALIKRVRKSDYVLQTPTNQDPFAILFYKNSAANTVLQKARINSGILKMQTIISVSYSYSTFK